MATATIINLAQIPSQSFKVTLDMQNCEIKIYQKKGRVYCDLLLDEVPQWHGALCRTGVLIKPVKYCAFRGDLAFLDTAGNTDPDYTGFGNRWILQYVPSA